MPDRMLRERFILSENLNAISDGAFRVWAHILVKTDGLGRFDARLRAIKALSFPFLQISLDDLREWIAELVENDLLTIYTDEKAVYGFANNFEKFNRLRCQHSAFPDPAECQHMTADDIRSGQMLTCDARVDIDKDKERETKKKPPKPKPKPQSNVPPAAFAAFWQLYPKKVAKQDALCAWQKLNPDDALIQTILAAVQRQIQSTDWLKENGTYIPYPATYLNGRRWEDETKSQATMEDLPRLKRELATMLESVTFYEEKLRLYPDHADAGQWRIIIEDAKRTASQHGAEINRLEAVRK